jgi:hypothetical protein
MNRTSKCTARFRESENGGNPIPTRALNGPGSCEPNGQRLLGFAGVATVIKAEDIRKPVAVDQVFLVSA